MIKKNKMKSKTQHENYMINKYDMISSGDKS